MQHNHARVPVMFPLGSYASSGGGLDKVGSFTYHMREPNGRCYDISPLPQMGITQVRKGVKKSHLTHEQEKEIASLYVSGTTTTELCQEFHIGSQTLADVLTRYGIKRRKAGRKKIGTYAVLSPEKEREVIEKYKAGASCVRLCIKYHIANSVLCEVFVRNQITKRSVGRPRV